MWTKACKTLTCYLTIVFKANGVLYYTYVDLNNKKKQGPDSRSKTNNHFYPKFLLKQSYNVFYKKNTLKKYDLQESYNNKLL